MAKKKTKKSKKGIAIAAAALIAIGAFSSDEEAPEPSGFGSSDENQIVSEEVVEENVSADLPENIEAPDNPEPVSPPEETKQETEVPTKQEPQQEQEDQQQETTNEVEQPPAVEVDQETAFRESLKQYFLVASSESDKYHSPSCHWTDKINDSNLVHFDSYDEAKASGYSACGTCQ